MYVQRTLSSQLREALGEFPAVLVTGPRQSGKTTFVRQELGRSALYISFDDPQEQDFVRSDPVGFLHRCDDAKIVILDEIQHVPELFPYLKLKIDADRSRLGRWVLTGSQQFGLMANVRETLAGRIALLELFPFSLMEWPLSKDTPSLEETIFAGQYPDPARRVAARDLWMQSYTRTYLERDVRDLLDVRDIHLFRTFFTLCAARTGQEVNLARLSRECGVSQPTAKSWLSVLEASFVVQLVPPYFENLGKRAVKSPKLHFVDTGIASYLTRQPAPAAAVAGSMGGALFEGLIVSEARKVANLHPGRVQLYHWRSNDGLEVDLLVGHSSGLIPVEIKLTSTPTSAHLRPQRRFQEIAGERASSHAVIVCQTREARTMPHGALALPWHEFGSWLNSVVAPQTSEMLERPP